MASVTVKVQTNELTNAASTIKNKVTALQNVVTALNNQIKTLNTYWTGDAHDAFETAINDDIREINDFIREAQDYQKDLTTIASAYEAAENANKSKLSNRSYSK